MSRPVLAGLALLWACLCAAHEVRPAYLELRETKPGEFSVLWKTPMQGEARLALDPQFSGAVESTPKLARRGTDAAIQTWEVRAPRLRGESVAISGLEGTMTDALVRIEFADGTVWTHRLTPRQPSAVVPAEPSALAVAGTYVVLGVEHILAGIDHLLFVLGLLMLARRRWQLIGTVTAFTIAHSITLALAALGVVSVPQAPVEAVIALSIAFVAAEILRGRRGEPGLASRAPWIVAFGFGLLHGFGFAGALTEAGLPQSHVALALLFFNVGVELGQLLFIAAALGVLWIVRARAPRWLEPVPAYAIGTMAMFWMVQRVAAF